eukprot:g3822.t1
MSSTRFTYLLLIAFCVASVTATEQFQGRTLLSRRVRRCRRACKAVARTDPEFIRKSIGRGDELCGCVCNATTGAGLLHTAVESKCGLCIELLTDMPASCSCDVMDIEGNTPLHYAASQCRMEITDDLIDAGCDIMSENMYNDTSLCVASRTDDEECGGVVRSLMAADADPCMNCSDNSTAIAGCVNQVVCDIMAQDQEEECE